MAKAARGGLGIVSLILNAGAIVLLLFVVLSGLTNTIPLRDVYFLRADTSGFAGTTRAISQWTYFFICGEGNQECGAAVPALAFGSAWRGDNAGVPESLVGSHAGGSTSTYYFYMWRFGWVFYLLALVFAVFAFFASFLAPCSRLASALSGVITFFALFWMSLAAALMTVTFVKARNVFLAAGIESSLGRYAFGFTWGAWAALFLAMLFLFLGARADKTDHVKTRSSRGRFFGRKKSTRSTRGSFIDAESQRRVKDEYA